MSVLDVRNPEKPTIVGRAYTDMPFYNRVLILSGNRIVWFDVAGKTEVYEINELPAITRQLVQNGKLNLEWNEPARGMKLQRATSVTNPVWQSLEGSESTIGAELPLWGGPEYFRLVKPE